MPRSALPRGSHRRAPLPRTVAMLGAAAAGLLVAAGLTAAPAAAQAPPEPPPGDFCPIVDYDHQAWETGLDQGRMSVTVTVTNVCGETVPGFRLALTLADGHTFLSGWNADWDMAGDRAVATYPPVNPGPIVPPAGDEVSLGYTAAWQGDPRLPVECAIDGEPCVFWPGTPQ